MSDGGVLAYRTGTTGEVFRLTWFDRAGKRLNTSGEPADYTVPQLSPDDRKLAVAVRRDIWIRDLARGTFSRLTLTENSCCPVWSPDGTKVAFRMDAGTGGDLYYKAASGIGQEEVLWKDERVKTPTDWSPDGRLILFQTTAEGRMKIDTLMLPLTGDRKPAALLQSVFNEEQARLSPDGRWVAYTSDESSGSQVYVQPFPSLAGKSQVSIDGGADPRWRRDGKELFFISADRKLMAVEIKPGKDFDAGVPRPLFDLRVSGLVDVRSHYAVTADGQRFLVNTVDEVAASSAITVVLNWTAGLQ